MILATTQTTRYEMLINLLESSRSGYPFSELVEMFQCAYGHNVTPAEVRRLLNVAKAENVVVKDGSTGYFRLSFFR